MHVYTTGQWVLLFFFYCFCGWVWESCYVSLCQRHWVNRGFLRATVHHRLGIFRHPAAEQFVGGILFEVYSIEIAGSEAIATADAFGSDAHLTALFIKMQAIIGAVRKTLAASAAFVGIYHRQTGAVLLLLART